MRLGFQLVLVAICAVSSACLTRHRSFDSIGSVSRIEVEFDPAQPVLVIDDRATIDAVMRFVNARRADWDVPWYGVPVPRVVADFYVDRDFVGHFGVGGSFFMAHRAGGFFCRDSTESERREFMDLLGVPFEKSLFADEE